MGEALSERLSAFCLTAIALDLRSEFNIIKGSVVVTMNISTDIKVGSRRVMGVSLPVITTEFQERSPYYSPAGTSFWIDNSLQSFKEALRILGKLAELKISVLRLANEVKKTIRKVNALEKIAIPDLQDTVQYIQSRLEENERDMFVLMKMVKGNLEKKKANAG